MDIVRLNDISVIDKVRYHDDHKKDFLAINLILPVICICRYVCERLGRNIFLQSNTAKKLRGKNLILNIAAKKFEEATWKFVYYSFISLYGFLFIAWEPFVRNTLSVYPNELSAKVSLYYLIQMSFYIWMTVCLLWDVRKKDFYQMCTHHGVTLTLLYLSYIWQLTNCGCVIMLLMDIADPFLELGKIFNYLKMETQSLICFALFIISFFSARLLLYPVFVMYPYFYDGWDVAVYFDKLWLHHIINGSIFVLFCLNIYWGVLILKVLIAKCSQGKLEDVRSDEEVD